MPIDFARIATTFRVPIGAAMKPISDAFERLGKWLKKRVDRATTMEQASRAYPTIGFSGGGVMAWIDTSQHGTLHPDAPRPIWESLRSGGAAFLGGVSRVGQSVQEALILPGLVGMIGEILDMIQGSMDRFSEPSPAMFDPRQRHASDLFGEMGLFFRAFGTSTGQIQGFVGGAQALRGSFQQPPSAGELLWSRLTSPPPAAPEQDLASTLDEAARYIVGAILALPLLFSLIDSAVRSGVLVLKVRMLDLFQGIETTVFRMRRQVIDFVYDGLFGYVREAIGFVSAVQYLLVTNLEYFVRFGLLYGLELLSGLMVFIHEASMYFRFWTDLVEALRSSLEAFLNLDLMPIIVPWLAIPGVPSPPFTFTIGDLFDTVVSGEMAAARAALTTWLWTEEQALRLVPFTGGIRARINGLRGVIGAALAPTPSLPPETRLPSLAGVTFPNVFDAFFGPGAPNIGRTLRGLRDEVLADVPQILGAGVDFLNGLSDAFYVAAGRAANSGSPAAYRAIAERAGGLAETAIGDQAAELRQRAAERPVDPLAQAFEGWLIHGGFTLIAGAVPHYVAGMQHYWQEQVEHPTSPHILARRARLGRVRMPRLVIRAPGRMLNDDLITEVAARFKGAVESAYQSGRAQYENAAAQ